MIQEASIVRKKKIREARKSASIDKTKSGLTAKDRNDIVACLALKEGVIRGK
ncbi:MAG: hypothetical protein JW984_06355 [Deltaproteobacteria bacterium]|uniref:Uncharacterized protein n=1 Tax=Candidatus Zymogenus saltonus TaxID=2844893 RepID=A0A9D8KEP8_9DELT|nr:hypothetical protein [Candidatus Zymogenus saltonus]